MSSVADERPVATNRSPRVSVCVPTINRPHFLREAIASVASQTFRDFEIVVGDNSGNAECQHQIDEVLAEFPDLLFTLVRHPHHIDVADNFNSLIDAAHGELWACLPDDDRFRPTFLERSIDALDRHPACAFTFADHWITDVEGVVNDRRTAVASVQFGRNLLHEGVYPHDQLFAIVLRQSLCLQAAVFRRSAIASLRFVPGILALDQSLFLRMSAGRTPFNGYYIDERLMEYRLHGAQVSTTTPRGDFLRTVIAAYESVDSVPARHARVFNAKLGRTYLALAMSEAEHGSRASARALAIKSLRLSSSVHNALGALLTIATPHAIPYCRHVVEQLRSLRGASNESELGVEP